MSRAAELLQRAQAATSLSHFGEDSFHEGLERLVAALDGEARLSALGRQACDMQIVDLLSNRLKVEDWYRRHPEIDEEQIVAPLIGLGLPRTGSTALSHMLGEDPQARSIRTWESLAPCPPPDAATQHDDPRIALAQQAMERRDRLFPRMKIMLPSSATTPTECHPYMAYDFKSQLFQAFAQVPSYVDWLNHRADLVPTYRYVKRVLKLLQWRCPPHRWRLKNPGHTLFIDALVQVFPDARFWMTHRDVARVIPSVADLYYELHQAYSDDVDKATLARTNTECWELGMRRTLAFRDAGHEHRFFDIGFAEFQRDPFPVLEKLYAFLGEDFTPQTRARMEAWRRDTPRERHGRHDYDAADFGIDLDALRRRFAFYAERFSLAEVAA
jgi:hypothetical protein